MTGNRWILFLISEYTASNMLKHTWYRDRESQFHCSDLRNRRATSEDPDEIQNFVLPRRRALNNLLLKIWANSTILSGKGNIREEKGLWFTKGTLAVHYTNVLSKAAGEWYKSTLIYIRLSYRLSIEKAKNNMHFNTEMNCSYLASGDMFTKGLNVSCR